MARDYSKQQTYYKITVWFKHSTKTYKLNTSEATMAFLEKAEKNDTIIYYMVVAVSNFIYPEYMKEKFKKMR